MPAGLFLLTFRPFKVGDIIAAAGITGTVREIGLFVTAIDTADYVRTYVGNNRLFSDNVQNFSANEFRRVDLTAQLPSGLDIEGTTGRVREALLAIPHVLRTPTPHVEILMFNPAGSTLAVRPLLPQRPLLAGVLRREPRHQPDTAFRSGHPPRLMSAYCCPSAITGSTFDARLAGPRHAISETTARMPVTASRTLGS